MSQVLFYLTLFFATCLDMEIRAGTVNGADQENHYAQLVDSEAFTGVTGSTPDTEGFLPPHATHTKCVTHRSLEHTQLSESPALSAHPNIHGIRAPPLLLG